MVSLLCELQPEDGSTHFESSSLDAPLADGSPNYTVDTLSTLRRESSPEDSLFVLLGADAFLGLHHWKSPDTLLELAEWIVVSRPGVSLESPKSLHLTPTQMERIHLLTDVQELASATNIRELLKAGSDCADLLPASILNYIRTHHLYGT